MRTLRTIIFCLCLAAVAFTQEESEVLAEDPQGSNIEANF